MSGHRRGRILEVYVDVFVVNTEWWMSCARALVAGASC
jgi:hypothetical protein